METIQSPTETKALKDHRCDFCDGLIQKGETYLKSTHKYDEVYTWKSHLICSELTGKLKMYDDEGITSDIFIEYVKNEYINIMSEQHAEQWESKDFKYPKFQEQLAFVAKQKQETNP